MVGLIGAMAVEVESLMAQMEDREEKRVGMDTFVSGRLFGQEAVLAVCGPGKINAALCAQSMIANFHPEWVLNLGVAGAGEEGVSIGDGPIDAAFVAIENITGCHYELDDFQLQAVTEGREAMGQTVVKLRSGGKVYSGKGISTDIVAAGIHAYLSALNKIVYEEEEV